MGGAELGLAGRDDLCSSNPFSLTEWKLAWGLLRLVLVVVTLFKVLNSSTRKAFLSLSVGAGGLGSKLRPPGARELV